MVVPFNFTLFHPKAPGKITTDKYLPKNQAYALKKISLVNYHPPGSLPKNQAHISRK